MALIQGKQIAGSSVPLSKIQTQTAQHILVGDASGDLASVALSGDATIASNGAITISNDAIIASKVQDAAITFAKLNSGAISSNLANSASATELARADAVKTYVDNVAQGLDVKDSVRVATTAAVTLASDLENGDSIDGVALATGNRILVKNQATASENGIYIVAASGAPARAADMAAASSAAGVFVFVEEGTTNADIGFVCSTNAGSDTVGTHNLAFSQFSGAGAVTAGDGLTKTGNSIALDINSVSNVSMEPADYFVFSDTSNNNAIRKLTLTELAVDLAGTGTSASTGTIQVGHLVSSDQFETASATTNDGDTTGVTITSAPSGMVQVFVNGVMAHLKGDKTGDCWFSADGGSTAKALNAIAASDTLYWKGSVAGYQLAATDKITLAYEAV